MLIGWRRTLQNHRCLQSAPQTQFFRRFLAQNIFQGSRCRVTMVVYRRLFLLVSIAYYLPFGGVGGGVTVSVLSTVGTAVVCTIGVVTTVSAAIFNSTFGVSTKQSGQNSVKNFNSSSVGLSVIFIDPVLETTSLPIKLNLIGFFIFFNCFYGKMIGVVITNSFGSF